MMEKFVEKENGFMSFEKVVCPAHRENNLAQDSSRGRGGRKGRGRNFRGRGGVEL